MMIYNSCIYSIIVLNVIMIKIVAYYLFILYYKYLKISDKRYIYDYIKEIKYELITDFHNYKSNEINDIIDDIIKIYIKYTCDFADDYHNNIKIEYSDIDVFIITKRIQIIDDIKMNLILNYKNKLIDDIQNKTNEYIIHLNHIFIN